MDFDYKLEARITPTSGRAGSNVFLEARFTEATEEIVRATALEASYGISFPLTKKEDGVFTCQASVPYGGPPGVYTINVYGVNAEGKRGPKIPLKFTLSNGG